MGINPDRHADVTENRTVPDGAGRDAVVSVKPRHAAYRNVKSKKVEIDGIKFASPGEAERYLELCIMKLRGEIHNLSLQPVFELQQAYRKCCGHVIGNEEEPVLFKKLKKCPICGAKMPIIRDIRYIADFRIEQNDGSITIEDHKAWGGYTTVDFKIKRKIFEFKHPELSLILLKRSGKPKVVAALLEERERLQTGRGDPCGTAPKCQPGEPAHPASADRK
jgi:hypothetical protein